MEYQLLKSLHILTMVTWLGTDIGTFIVGIFRMRMNLPPEVRYQFGRVAALLDMFPRLSLVLSLVTGLTLAYMSWGLKQWLGGMAVPMLTITWIVAATWIVFMLHSFMTSRQEGGYSENTQKYLSIFRYTDLCLRVILLAGVLAFVGVVIVGNGPFTMAWLNWKLFVFGIILTASIGMRLTAWANMNAVSEQMRTGSTEVQALLQRRIVVVRALVLTIFSCIGAMIVISVAKPL
jgi:uncharacterized membrane protein